MKSIINFILDFFGINRRTKKEKDLDSKREKLEERLKDIEDEENSLDDIIDHFNK